MKYLFFLFAFTYLAGCAQMMPDVMKTIDDIATDDAIIVQVDRDAIKKDTDIRIQVDVINKESSTLANNPVIIPPAPAPATPTQNATNLETKKE